jgi:hypothetical protein
VSAEETSLTLMVTALAMSKNLNGGGFGRRPIRPAFAAQPSFDPSKVKVFEAKTSVIPGD